jgi:hypothetical protein
MIGSIQSHDSNAVIALVCHDEETKELAQKWAGDSLKIVGLDELEKAHPGLKSIKLDRIKLEFIYSLSPYVVQYFFDTYDPLSVTYVDADLYFFSSVTDIVSHTEESDVGIVGHRFRPKMKHLEKFGIFNVGLVHFNNTSGGRNILKFWLDSCSKSTSTNATTEVFGDQKYLDKFSTIGKVHIFNSPGINAAPWNCNDIGVSATGELQIEQQRLMFFHFSGLKIFKFYSTLSYSYYEWRPSKRIKKLLFAPYVKNLLTLETTIFGAPLFDKRTIKPRQLLQFINNRDLLIN